MAKLSDTSANALRVAFADFDGSVALTERELPPITGFSLAWHKRDRTRAANLGEPLRGPQPTIVYGSVRYLVRDVRQWLDAQRTLSSGLTNGRDGRRANQLGRPRKIVSQPASAAL